MDELQPLAGEKHPACADAPRTLWRPEFEHDACGIGALANINGHKSHQILDDALPSSSTSSTAAASGSSATPATAPAFSSRSRTASFARRPRSAARSSRKRAITAWRCCFCLKTSRA